MSTESEQRMAQIREIIGEVLELDDDEFTDTGHFVEDYEADSLRAIEILARLEKKYNVEIPQSELARMINVKTVYEVLAEHAGWRD